jgi:hypothetical protein
MLYTTYTWLIGLTMPYYSNIYPKRCNVKQFIYIWKLLYMFRVVPPPIIRSTNSCTYSIWYLSHRYCYLPLSWKSWNWFECWVFETLTRIFKFYYNLRRITSTLHEDFLHFLSHLAQFFLEWESFKQIYGEKIEHFLCSVKFFSKIVRFMRYVRNMVESGKSQKTT